MGYNGALDNSPEVGKLLRSEQRQLAAALGWKGRLRMISASNRVVNALVAMRHFIVGRRETPLWVPAGPPPLDISEGAFMALVVEHLEAAGWAVHHETISSRTKHGFPDLVAVRPPRLLIAELKTTKGAPDLAQLWWMEDLLRCKGDTFTYHFWTPCDWTAILLAIAPPNTPFEPHQTIAHLTK